MRGRRGEGRETISPASCLCDFLLSPGAGVLLRRLWFRLGSEVRVSCNPVHIEDLERKTQQALDCLFEREGKKWLPDVIYVEDDYQAIGALFSLMSHGVKIPDDVRFATVKNYGHGPALPISLTCVEFNPAEAGASVAQAALDFLGGKGFSHDSTSGFRYMIGDTFPEAKEGANR